MEKRKTERRKVNQAIGDERRGAAKDRRSCPQCGSTVRSHSRSILGGTITHRYCGKCHWKAVSRQVDEERLVELAGLETEVVGTLKQPMLQLNANFLKVAKLKPGSQVELKPLYTPGASQTLTWILKKID